MMYRGLSSALLGSVIATSQSADCIGDQCAAQPGTHTQANTLLQIASKAGKGRVNKVVEVDEPTGPSKDWTEEEAMLVMGKIHYTLTKTGTVASGDVTPMLKDYECMSGPGLALPCNNSFNYYCHVSICQVDNVPDLDRLAAKYLRLGFHGCIPDDDGGGGCNGCLSFGTMFGKFTQLHGYANQVEGSRLRQYKDQEEDTGNNGLSGPADILEAIYTDKDYPSGTWPLDVSLKESGKSRADLWALAALVSAEYSMQENNLRCKGEGEVQPYCEHNHVANQLESEFPCEITVDKPPVFWTGRSDCAEEDKPKDPATSSVVPHRNRDYETTKKDNHPSTTMNGTQVGDYMKAAFEFSYQETVAIMGAHSIGGFKFSHSFHKYNWQRGNSHLMNNNYYRIMMAKPAKFLRCGDGEIPATAFGKPGQKELAQTGWWVRPLRELKSGGPYLWFHYYYRCPACYRDDAGAWVNIEMRGLIDSFQSTKCCLCNEQTEAEVDPLCYIKVTQDETAISSDLGLYYQFEVGEHGIPMNCPGTPVDEWNAERVGDASLDTLTKLTGGLNTWDLEPKCPRNTAKEEGDDKSLSDYVELYATNQNVWANAFYAAMEKMLHNGYAPGELVKGPDVLGIGKATCGQIKLKGKSGWNYGCARGDNVKVASRRRKAKEGKR